MTEYCWHATDLIKIGFIARDGLLRGTPKSKYRPSGAPDPVWWSTKQEIDITASAARSRAQGIPSVIIQVELDKTMPFSLDALKEHFGWSAAECADLMRRPLTKKADISTWRISHNMEFDFNSAKTMTLDPNGRHINEPIVSQAQGGRVTTSIGTYVVSATQIMQDGSMAYLTTINTPHPSDDPSAPQTLFTESRQERRARERAQAKMGRRS